MDNLVGFFLCWTVFGLIYYMLKIIHYEEVYDNETKLGKFLTIFIGGPITWIIGMVNTKVKFLNKKVL